MRRAAAIAILVFCFLAGAATLGFGLALQSLKNRIGAALGPGSRVADLKVRWSSVDLAGVAIDAAPPWPASRAFYAERVSVVPSPTTLLSEEVRILSITIDRPYLSVLRAPGKLLLVPSLLEATRGGNGAGSRSTRSVAISKIALRDGVIELFDAAVRRPPLRIRLERISAAARDIHVPALARPLRFESAGLVKGRRRDGTIEVSGWVAERGGSSFTVLRLRDLDLTSVEPYLIRRDEARLAKGALDLELRSSVRKRRLDGKGRIAIRDLEFAPARSYAETFMGLPRAAVASFLKDRNGVIEMEFTLAGDIGHPRFSLDEALATRIAAGIAEQLGMSVRGVAEGFEAIGRKGIEGAGAVTEAIGAAFRGLLGGREKP